MFGSEEKYLGVKVFHVLARGATSKIRRRSFRINGISRNEEFQVGDREDGVPDRGMGYQIGVPTPQF